MINLKNMQTVLAQFEAITDYSNREKWRIAGYLEGCLQHFGVLVAGEPLRYKVVKKATSKHKILFWKQEVRETYFQHLVRLSQDYIYSQPSDSPIPRIHPKDLDTGHVG